MDVKIIFKKIIKAFVPYGILWLKRKYFKKVINHITRSKLKKIIHKDYKFPIIVRNKTSDIDVYNAIIVNGEYKFETEMEPKIIIDAGANIGLASVYFANKYPNATIVAIEPEQSNYEMLVKNTENYTNVKCIRAALFNRVGKIDLLDVGLDKWGFITEMNDNYKQIKMNNIKKLDTVNSITINTIMENYNIMEIDILKIDIEGAEKEVFTNAFEWILKVKSIIVELHDRMKVGCSRSFYCNTNGFDNEWQKGEDIYLVRGNYIKR